MTPKNDSTILTVFQKCVDAISSNKLIRRESKQDKEFHFQNWVRARLDGSKYNYEVGGRNSYPDFRIVSVTEGYEVKGLAYPGREVNYDCNSQVPTGLHNGRSIYYVFGRYPAEPDGNTYPVLDLVICHGDFLNADHVYVHKNKSVKGFGSYGDIMIRDRKMYVAPTPFGLATGLAHAQTLILPADISLPKNYRSVGKLVRKEADKLIIGYTFDLKNNIITPKTIPNPNNGKEHSFQSWRLSDGSDESVIMHERHDIEVTDDEEDTE